MLAYFETAQSRLTEFSKLIDLKTSKYLSVTFYSATQLHWQEEIHPDRISPVEKWTCSQLWIFVSSLGLCFAEKPNNLKTNSHLSVTGCAENAWPVSSAEEKEELKLIGVRVPWSKKISSLKFSKLRNG